MAQQMCVRRNLFSRWSAWVIPLDSPYWSDNHEAKITFGRCLSMSGWWGTARLVQSWKMNGNRGGRLPRGIRAICRAICGPLSPQASSTSSQTTASLICALVWHSMSDVEKQQQSMSKNQSTFQSRCHGSPVGIFYNVIQSLCPTHNAGVDVLICCQLLLERIAL